VIYTLAAYSITVGVLALYGVLMQHRRRVVEATVEATASRSGFGSASDPTQGFNLGAMLLAPVWMMAHGMRVGGALLLAVWVALWPLAQQQAWITILFVGAVPLAAGAALGFVGNRIAVEHRGLERAGTLSASQLPWALAGISLHVFVLPWVVLFLLDR
jgi:hypothetical protein